MASETLSANERTVSIAVMVASIGSIIFAVFMIGGYIFIPSLRTFRHRLILGLAIAEFFLALNFLAATISSLAGHPLGSIYSTTFCSFTGFMTQMFFLMIDLWVLAIAVMTYLTIAEKTRACQFAQRHQAWIWIAIWLFSIACASIGIGVWGYSDIGGFCWFESTKLRLILNYMPRWIVIITTMVLYCRTFVLIRRAQREGLIRAVRGNSGPKASSSGMSSSQGTDPSLSVPTAATFSASSGGSSTLFSGTARRESNYSVLERQRERDRQHERLRRTSFLMTAYPVCYAILWSIPTIVMVYQVSNMGGKPLPVGLDCLAKVTIALNGFISGHIYGFNERSQMAWVDLIVSSVLRIQKSDRRASCSSNLADWNAYAVGVDELQVGERRPSVAPKTVSVPIVSNRAINVDLEKGRSSFPSSFPSSPSS